MTVLKDVAAIVNDAARIWGEVLHYKLQHETKSLTRCAIGFVVEVLMIVAAFVLAGVGVALVLSGCWPLLTAALGQSGGTLLLGGIVILVAMVLGLGISNHIHKT